MSRQDCPGDFVLGVDSPTFFNLSSAYAVSLAGQRSFKRVKLGGDDEAFARAHSVHEGVLLPLVGHFGRGRLVYKPPSFSGVEHLRFARSIAIELVSALDSAHALERESGRMVERARLALARDLHDTVAQSLSGARFWLRSIKSKLSDGRSVVREVEDLSERLLEQQAQVQGVISLLRGDLDPERVVALSETFEQLAYRLSRQWEAKVEISVVSPPVSIPAALAKELQHLMRESVSNAVRHGSARTVGISLTFLDMAIELVIRDDGAGFADTAIRPRSISERVDLLGGTLDLSSRAGSTVLNVHIPAGVT